MFISGQICGSKLQRVFTLGDGCWLPIKSAKKGGFRVIIQAGRIYTHTHTINTVGLAIMRGCYTMENGPNAKKWEKWEKNLENSPRSKLGKNSVEPKVRLQGYGYNLFCSHSSRCLAVLV